MIDTDSSRVTGFIDFEVATIAPLWECAVIPRWLQDVDGPESSYEGGTSEERRVLHAAFLSAMEGSARYLEWRGGNVCASNDHGIWLDECPEWAKTHPRMGCLKRTIKLIHTS
ncbi:hypothetical protein DEU56DRAFT_839228 [Suillus clintonianus]|uniref:uncharacterized protein n=1 Tax=Suillus clintonianus TaxID=1904413 RepID=UPI001B868043|nr:uncharacterized protein DEU56DRAFT_839228 [Suillus clintonianus]KAG2117583.1 hypothetical protein DEU56DRAFT_839228 [Suillus clintonianus]